MSGVSAGAFIPGVSGIPDVSYRQNKVPFISMFGSSLTDVCFASSSLYGVQRRLDRSWIDHAIYAMPNKQIYVYQTYAVGGSTISDIKSQISSALSDRSDWVIGDLGVINDIIGGKSLTNMINTMKDCVNLIGGSNKRGVILNSSPLFTGHPNSNSTTAKLQISWNKELQAACAKAGVIYVDVWGLMVNPTSSNGIAKANYLQADNIHYSELGSRAIGVLLASLMSPYLPTTQLLSTSVADIYDATNNPNRLSDLPLFTSVGGTNNTGGTITNAATAGTVTGGVPAGCTLSKAGTWGAGLGTTGIDSNSPYGFGSSWTVTVSRVATGAADDRLFMGVVPSVHSRVAVGDVVFGIGRIDLTGMTNLNECQIYLSITVDGVNTLHTVYERSNENPAQSEYDSTDWTGGWFMTPQVTVPAGSLTNLQIVVSPRFSSTTSAATIKVYQANMYKVLP